MGDFAALRDIMVMEQLEARGIRDSAVLAAMREVPREMFVLPDLADLAYDDGPLPIDEGQGPETPHGAACRLREARHPGRRHPLFPGSGSCAPLGGG